MKKYRIGGYYVRIEEIEILRETESSVFIATTHSRKKEQREAKVSSYHQYHDTWEAAHKYLLEKASVRVASASRRLDYETATLKTIKAMRPEGGEMSIIGWYYLHTNGDLLYKRELEGTAADIRESSFAKMLWPVDSEDRAGAWRIVVEALACGANPERVKELADKWGCNNDDAKIYAKHIGVILGMDGNQWCATRKDFVNLQESPAGFGDTAAEAFSGLCKELKFKPVKTLWGGTFADLVKCDVPRGGN